jgi:2,4-dienoyl-CoA reductase-like NADH-dependent reductase (Old Yellow Enzyme family)
MRKLFSPLRLGALELVNRIVIPPMCQYSAIDGSATDWHVVHWGHLVLSGAGLLIVEATAVEPEGRISPSDLGLWNDTNAEALTQVVQTIRKYSTMPLGIQLAHAGRKASTAKPWEGDRQVAPANGGWETVAPSHIPFRADDSTPQELTKKRIDAIIDSFVEAAKRAAQIGFDLVEIHSAQGYLLHECLSPSSNRRDDEFGGTLKNRMQMTLRVFHAVRDALPREKTIGVRISATDWVEGGWKIEDSIALSRELEQSGCDYIHVSSGGLSGDQKITLCPGYQVPLARQIKENVNMPVIAVGLITEPQHAESIIATGEADLVAIGRGMLFDPRWPWHAAVELGAQVTAPNQYLRSAPHSCKNLFMK